MTGRGFAAAVCVLLAAGCASASDPLRSPLPDLAPAVLSPPIPYGDDDYEAPERPFRIGIPQDRYSVALWAWRPHLASEGPAGGNAAAGARFEWSCFEPGKEDGRIPVHGVLVEVLLGRSESADREEVTHAFEAGVWWTSGSVTGARGEPFEGIRGYDFRSDFLLGFRLVRAEERDDDVGSLFHGDRDHVTAPEFSIGWRVELSPVQGAAFFARSDVGLFLTAATFEWVAGVRIEPVRDFALEAGWRGLSTAGGTIFNSMSYSWNGPWAGVVVSF